MKRLHALSPPPTYLFKFELDGCWIHGRDRDGTRAGSMNRTLAVIPRRERCRRITRDPVRGCRSEVTCFSMFNYSLFTQQMESHTERITTQCLLATYILQTLNTCRPVALKVVVVLTPHSSVPLRARVVGARAISSATSSPANVSTASASSSGERSYHIEIHGN